MKIVLNVLSNTLKLKQRKENSMLKIKENIDLKCLEKFGFKINGYTHLLVLREDEHDFASIDVRNRIYEILDLCNKTYNLTYDLIQSSLVEKM